MRCVLLVASLLLCQCASGTRNSAPPICPEDGYVLRTVIRHVLDGKPTSTNQILVLYGQTLGDQLLDAERDLQFRDDALRAFRSRNLSMESLPVCFSEEPIVIAAPSLIQRIGRSPAGANENQQFATTFPKASGVYSFHLPGYTSDGKRALVHYMWTAGPLAVESVWVSLVKHSDTWTIEWQEVDWAS